MLVLHGACMLLHVATAPHVKTAPPWQLLLCLAPILLLSPHLPTPHLPIHSSSSPHPSPCRNHHRQGDPAETLPKLVRDAGAGLLVTDYSPLRLGRRWRDAVAGAIGGVAMHEVDAHNVVPVWAASDKREYAARTIR